MYNILGESFSDNLELQGSKGAIFLPTILVFLHAVPQLFGFGTKLRISFEATLNLQAIDS